MKFLLGRSSSFFRGQSRYSTVYDIIRSEFQYKFNVATVKAEQGFWAASLLLRLQTIKAIVNSRKFKGSSSGEPRRVQVLDLYCLTRFESESSGKEDVY